MEIKSDVLFPKNYDEVSLRLEIQPWGADNDLMG